MLLRSPQQQTVSMKFQDAPLFPTEAAHIDDTLGFNTHSGQRRFMHHRRDDQPARIIKTDEATVKEVIDFRWSSNPFSRSKRSSLFESRHGLQDWQPGGPDCQRP
jgi:hypothetical protein